jgi:putative phage-type endonuclease
MRIINIAQRTDEWHDWRKQGITGTDAAVLLGLHDKKTPWRIWAEKLGKVPPEDLSGNPNVQRGIALEPIAREAIEQKHDLLLLPVCGEHEEHAILRASFDGIDDNGRPVEIKCPGDKVWASINKGGDESLEYRRYVVRCQPWRAKRGLVVPDRRRRGCMAVVATERE